MRLGLLDSGTTSCYGADRSLAIIIGTIHEKRELGSVSLIL